MVELTVPMDYDDDMNDMHEAIDLTNSLYEEDISENENANTNHEDDALDDTLRPVAKRIRRVIESDSETENFQDDTIRIQPMSPTLNNSSKLSKKSSSLLPITTVDMPRPVPQKPKRYYARRQGTPVSSSLSISPSLIPTSPPPYQTKLSSSSISQVDSNGSRLPCELEQLLVASHVEQSQPSQPNFSSSSSGSPGIILNSPGVFGTRTTSPLNDSRNQVTSALDQDPFLQALLQPLPSAPRSTSSCSSTDSTASRGILFRGNKKCLTGTAYDKVLFSQPPPPTAAATTATPPRQSLGPRLPYTERETYLVFSFLQEHECLLFLHSGVMCSVLSELKVVERSAQSIQSHIKTMLNAPDVLKPIVREDLFEAIRSAKAEIQARPHTHGLTKKKANAKFKINLK
ncbi:unnamed protein product [Orchesella dallaii]|uniref:BEN domain-containing protein n=1 Tax=Orchesella dallaii TaxID=48710 RepID=A0ABP1S817_9HEXA